MKYFKIFDITPKFIFEKQDIANLENSFLSLQKNLYSGINPLNISESTLNLAYETLNDEAKRLEYIIENKGFNVFSFTINPTLAERIFELREELEDAKNLDEISQKINNVKKELENLKIVIEKELNTDKLEKSTICDLFSEFKCLNEVIKIYK